MNKTPGYLGELALVADQIAKPALAVMEHESDKIISTESEKFISEKLNLEIFLNDSELRRFRPYFKTTVSDHVIVNKEIAFCESLDLHGGVNNRDEFFFK